MQDQSTNRQWSEGTSPLCGVINTGDRKMKDWKDHNGVECPVKKGTLVDVQHRDGEIYRREKAGKNGYAEDWSHSSHPADIIRYRVAEPETNDTANILRQIADEIERVGVERAHEGFECSVSHTHWTVPGNTVQLFEWIVDSNITTRPRPRTIQIGDHTVPEPLRVAPEYGTTFYTADLSGDASFGISWEDDFSDFQNLKKGIVHLDPDAALQHARALIAVSGGETDQ